MLCTACGRIDTPDTRVAGSDVLELVLWALLVVPGLVYCGWRHAQRSRICPHCGSAALMRESRASRQRSRAAPAAEAEGSSDGRGRVVYAARRIPWMANPSQRFRRVSRAGAALAALGVTFAVVSVNTVRVSPGPQTTLAQRVAPTEAQVEKTREARIESRREHECERLCAEFHRAQARSHRRCMTNCAAQLFDDPRVHESAGACADLLDRSACDYVSGKTATTRSQPEPGLAAGTSSALPDGRR
jgi:hypothetical protein